jgi:hypothetical protein
MLYATSALVTLLLLVVPAHAIEVTVLAKETADTPAIVLLEGQIEQGDDEKFQVATARMRSPAAADETRVPESL